LRNLLNKTKGKAIMNRNSSPRLRNARLAAEQLEARNLLSATLTIDNAVTHQVINGWGTEFTKEYEPGPDQLAEILSLAYGQLHLNLGQAGQLLEAPVPDFTQTQDSDPDPFTINWNGFQGWQERDIHDNWINGASTIPDGNGGYLTAKDLGFTGYVLGASFPNIRWENKWLDPIRQSDVPTYRQKVAREVLAYELYYQNNYGEVPPLFQFGNEEITGNRAIYFNGDQDRYPGGSAQEMVDLIKTTGQRLADNGVGSVHFLVGSEETVTASYGLASAILADPQAAQYVGVLGYHEYPYGSAYSSLAQVLHDSGTGNPQFNEIQARNQLRDLAERYGLPLWLTEVSHGSEPGNGIPGLPGDSFDSVRARAIDIHDNLVYADVSAFWLQGTYWDTVLQRGHFGDDLTLAQLQALDGADFAVLGDPTTDTWQLTTGGYALGHYSRWVHPGDIRVDSNSNNALVQVTAFRDDANGNDVFVVINNSSQDQTVTLTLANGAFGGALYGEQSVAGTLWNPLDGIVPDDATHVTVVLPAQSVTSLAAPLGSGPGFRRGRLAQEVTTALPLEKAQAPLTLQDDPGPMVQGTATDNGLTADQNESPLPTRQSAPTHASLVVPKSAQAMEPAISDVEAIHQASEIFDSLN
jgi:O-glycosyl hydrolase